MVIGEGFPKVLGSKEIEVMARLRYYNINIITNDKFKKMFSDELSARKMIYRLMKKRIFRPITKGVYYFSPPDKTPYGTFLLSLAVPAILFPKKNLFV